MSRSIAIMLALCAGAAALAAAMIGDRIDASRVLFGIAAACATSVVAIRGGAFAGVAAGAASALVFASGAVPNSNNSPIPSAVVGACLLGIGWFCGRSTSTERDRARHVEQELQLARRDLYRMKKEAGKVSRGTVRSVAAPEPAPAAAAIAPSCAPAQDVAAFASTLVAISGALNEDRLVEALSKAARDACGAAGATIFMLDRRNDRLLPGRGADGKTDVQAAESEALIRLALKSRTLLARADLAPDANQNRQAFETAGADVEFAAPVFDRQLSAGVMIVRRSGVDVGAAKSALNALAAVGGLALANARLGRQSEQSSKTDPLTGLPNAASVREILDEKLARGVASVLLVAADSINQVNQSYGRRAGDKAIAALARLVAMEVGSDGVVGYGGGATLLVVIPGRRGEPVRALAERLMRRVPTSVTAGPEGIARPLTISVGSASALVGPADALLAEAERSLAAAIGAGGNRLVEASPDTATGARA